MANRFALRELKNFQDLRMDGRFAAGNLHQIRLALAFDQGLEHRVYFGERAVARLLRRGVGEANRAGEVALVVDLDQREAGMLLVIGAKTAIVGAAAFRAALEGERPVAGLQPILL